MECFKKGLEISERQGENLGERKVWPSRNKLKNKDLKEKEKRINKKDKDRQDYFRLSVSLAMDGLDFGKIETKDLLDRNEWNCDTF